MRKATFIMSALSFVASALTLAVVFKGVRDVQNEVEDLRAKTNKALTKIKVSLTDFSV